MKNNYLALDYWTRKTGLAYNTLSFAFSLATVPTNELIEKIASIIADKKITAIVIGMPYNIDGTMSKHGKRVKNFAKNLEQFSLPVFFHDERLTTSAARISFSENSHEGDIDAESARLILEDFFEKHGE